MEEEQEDQWEEYNIPCIECGERKVTVTVPIANLNEDDEDDVEEIRDCAAENGIMINVCGRCGSDY